MQFAIYILWLAQFVVIRVLFARRMLSEFRVRRVCDTEVQNSRLVTMHGPGPLHTIRQVAAASK